jgi:hypothetical protein
LAHIAAIPPEVDIILMVGQGILDRRELTVGLC